MRRFGNNLGDGIGLWPVEDNGFAATLICRNASRVIEAGGFSPSDLEDIEQQLLIELWRKRTKFNHRRGPWCVFVTVVVENAASKILRGRFALKRNEKRTVSLNRRVRLEEDSVDFSELVSLDKRRQHFHSTRQIDLEMDVAELLQTYPPEWRNVLERMSRESLREIALDIGVPRTTLIAWLKFVRKRFAHGMMHKYF